MEEEKYKVPLFNGENFSNWKYKMETVLEDQDLLWTIQMDADESTQGTQQQKLKAQRKSKSILIQKIADSHLEYVKRKETPLKIWQTLVETFERKGVKSQLHTLRFLLSLKYDDKQKLESHLLELNKLIRELNDGGSKPTESLCVCLLLLSLPKS